MRLINKLQLLQKTICVFSKNIFAVMLIAFIILPSNSLIISEAVGLVRPPKALTDSQATNEAKSLMSFQASRS